MTEDDVVEDWDVVEDGVLGARIVCASCDGDGEVEAGIESNDPGEPLACARCDGTGLQFRPYRYRNVEINVETPNAFLIALFSDER